jgi:hypothetical protein
MIAPTPAADLAARLGAVATAAETLLLNELTSELGFVMD